MAAGVTAQIDLRVSASNEGSNAFGGPYWSGDFVLQQLFANGTGAGQFDKLYMAERTVASATNDDIDLSGVITDVFGATITAVEIVGIMVANRRRDEKLAANTTNLTIGAGSNPATVGWLGGTTPTIKDIRPGGMFLMFNPDASGMGAITASTGDILRIANSSGAANTYVIALLLRSA